MGRKRNAAIVISTGILKQRPLSDINEVAVRMCGIGTGCPTFKRTSRNPLDSIVHMRLGVCFIGLLATRQDLGVLADVEFSTLFDRIVSSRNASCRQSTDHTMDPVRIFAALVGVKLVTGIDVNGTRRDFCILGDINLGLALHRGFRLDPSHVDWGAVGCEGFRCELKAGRGRYLEIACLPLTTYGYRCVIVKFTDCLGCNTKAYQRPTIAARIIVCIVTPLCDNIRRPDSTTTHGCLHLVLGSRMRLCRPVRTEIQDMEIQHPRPVGMCNVIRCIDGQFCLGIAFFICLVILATQYDYGSGVGFWQSFVR